VAATCGECRGSRDVSLAGVTIFRFLLFVEAVVKLGARREAPRRASGQTRQTGDVGGDGLNRATLGLPHPSSSLFTLRRESNGQAVRTWGKRNGREKECKAVTLYRHFCRFSARLN
jgi:hypothetical protein